jgi:hypothetical protein
MGVVSIVEINAVCCVLIYIVDLCAGTTVGSRLKKADVARAACS